MNQLARFILFLFIGMYILHTVYIAIVYSKIGTQNLLSKIGKLTFTNSANYHDYIKPFKILGWTGSKYGDDWQMKGSQPFQTCKYSNCYGTTDKNQYNSSDVILFMLRSNFMPIVGFPNHRFSFQKWVIHESESPMWEKVVGNMWQRNNIFNVTWTYSKTSDIWTNYSHPRNFGGLFQKVIGRAKSSKNYALGKIKPIAWFLSRCSKERMFRLNYATNLQKFIPVDIYGKCGPLKCEKRTPFRYCSELLEKEYKFYLSFENSLCDDYVTEKLWTALRLNIVPIVLGAYNYSELLPPKTYIDIKDYSSPKALAEYLHTLDKNDTLYNEYLQRKDMYEIVPHAPFQCSVCEYINKSVNETKIYDRLDLFWNKKLQCHKPEEFYKNIDLKVWQD